MSVSLYATRPVISRAPATSLLRSFSRPLSSLPRAAAAAASSSSSSLARSALVHKRGRPVAPDTILHLLGGQRPLALRHAARVLPRDLDSVVRRFSSSSASPSAATTSSPSPSTSTPPSSSSSSSSSSKEAPKSAYARFKDLTKTYGSYAIIMYLALTVVDFSLTFAVVHAVGVERIEPYLAPAVHWYRVTRFGEEGAAKIEAEVAAEHAKEVALEKAESIGIKKERAWWENKALWAEAILAYTIHKTALLPIRAGLTVAWTPRVVQWLRARGWVGTAGAKRAAAHGAEKVREARQRVVNAAKGV